VSVAIAFWTPFIAAITHNKPARMKGDRHMPDEGEEPPLASRAAPLSRGAVVRATQG
jgi:hypothetical protein